MSDNMISAQNRRYIVLSRKLEDGEFGFFVHEADLLLGVLGEETYSDRMTREEARQQWLPYRHLDESLYDPDEREEDDPHQGVPNVFGDWD